MGNKVIGEIVTHLVPPYFLVGPTLLVFLFNCGICEAKQFETIVLLKSSDQLAQLSF